MSKPPHPPGIPTFVDLAQQWQAAGMAWMRWWLAPPTGRDDAPPAGEPAFEVGRNLAVTPGSVVFRNDLVELIQYAPTTKRVGRRPLVVVAPCTRKYYLLDLTPESSFVRWVVAQGHTVFAISWCGTRAERNDRQGWDAHIDDGVLAALRAAKEIAGSPTLNTVGYGIGGTLLACALAVLAARRERSVASATLLATRLDFADGGDADDALEADASPASALAHWRADASAVPTPVTAWSRANLERDNLLCRPGALTVAGVPLDLRRITAPTYVFAARDDRVVPWQAAYRTTELLGGDVTFVLGSSGHVGGVINPPAAASGRHWTNDLVTAAADDWQARAVVQPGSWWPHWATWLAPHAGAAQAAPSTPGSKLHPPLCAAPGAYVLRERS
jgi:polyhydroxyalkanoate synthase